MSILPLRKFWLTIVTALVLEMFGSGSRAWSAPPPYKHFERAEPNREPQPNPPWFDLAHMEANVLGGVATFSPDFSDHIEACGAAMLHVPTPGLPIPMADRLGLYGEFIGGMVNRKPEVPVPDAAGAMFLGGAGAEFTFFRDKDMIFTGQAGFLYADFGGITDVENGIGPSWGLEFSFYVDGPIWFTYSPQFAYAPKNSDWILFQFVGIRIEF